MLRVSIFMLVLIFAQSVNGQDDQKKANSKLFYKFYAGYGFLTPGSFTISSQISLNYSQPIGIGQSIYRKTEASKGLGHSFRVGVGIGIIETDFLNIGLDAELMIKDEITNKLSREIDANNFVSATDRIGSSILTLTPHVIFKALAKPKFFVYNKLGVLVTLPFSLNTSGSYEYSSLMQQYNQVFQFFGVTYFNSLFSDYEHEESAYDRKYKMSLGIGVNVAFGINYRINDNLRFFGEIFGNYTGLSPKSSNAKTNLFHHTLYTLDSTGFHYEMPQDYGGFTDNATVYKKDGSIGFNGTGYTSRKYTINMSALGINVGIVRRFR